MTKLHLDAITKLNSKDVLTQQQQKNNLKKRISI